MVIKNIEKKDKKLAEMIKENSTTFVLSACAARLVCNIIKL